MLSQRVPNIAGMLAIENSPFGYIKEKQHHWRARSATSRASTGRRRRRRRHDPFNELYIRTWRDLARYRGPEALGQEGPNALMRLPSLMEEILDCLGDRRRRPQFKAEYIVTHNITASLEAAARAAAKRLKMSPAETETLIDRFIGYPYPRRDPA